MASTSLWSTWTNAVTQQSYSPTQPSSAALDFLAAIATSSFEVQGLPEGITLHGYDNNILGRGGFSVVERGSVGGDKNELVAIKYCHLLSANEDSRQKDAFRTHLRHISQELRILGHSTLKIHRNIVQLLGVCLDDGFGSPFLALILELSPFGTLRDFLLGRHDELACDTLLSLISQASQGLAATHKANVCHGDVKTSNVLVFQEHEHWVVKISDFGQSEIGNPSRPSAAVHHCLGTRLLNAPEIRRAEAAKNQLFDFNAAIQTDIFSFGLLAWEVSKHDRSFFDNSWISIGGDESIDGDIAEEYLNNLPYNGLLSKALDYSQRSFPGGKTEQALRELFCGCLQDNPQERSSVSSILKSIRKTTNELYEPVKMDELDEHPIRAWTIQDSLFQLYDTGVEREILFRDIPFPLQQHVRSEFEALASTEDISLEIRGHAAIRLAECYILGFGAVHDREMILFWLAKAAALENTKASLCYFRICIALKSEPDPNHTVMRTKWLSEKFLSHLSSELYLSRRISLQHQSALRDVKDDFEKKLSLSSRRQSNAIVKLGFFNDWEYDELLPIHAAAFIGDDTLLTRILENEKANPLSAWGLSAIHYACLGGQLSSLEILTKHNVSASTSSAHGLSPLHFCICFAEHDTERAVNLLLKAGADPNTNEVEEIQWNYHDIVLHGSPIDWAVRTRNRSLVRILLPYSDVHQCLHIAIRHFFWELAEDLLNFLERTNSIPKHEAFLEPVQRPFSHWIAHGQDHSMSIKRTVQICEKFGLLQSPMKNTTLLKCLLAMAQVEDDFVLIEACLDIFSPSYVKRIGLDGYSAFTYAISISKNKADWIRPLKKMAELYTVEELEQCPNPVLAGTIDTYLHLAIIHGSVSGARLLLEHGVDVNKSINSNPELTLLHICGISPQSSSLYSLLIEFGADDGAKGPFGGQTPAQYGFMFDNLRKVGRSRSPHLEEGDEHGESNTGESLKKMMMASIAMDPSGTLIDGFRLLLRSKHAREYINAVDENGMTLLHRASRLPNFDSIALLLESNADARTGYIPDDNGTPLLPLQIACFAGRMADLELKSEKEIEARKQSAMRIAFELLQWHRAKSDGLFKGITKLHLAARMQFADEVRRLKMRGFDMNAPGHWPGVPGITTPKQLADETLGGELATFIKLNRAIFQEM